MKKTGRPKGAKEVIGKIAPEMKRRKRKLKSKELGRADLLAQLEKMDSENATLGYDPTNTQRVFRDNAARYKLLTGPNRGGKTGHIAWEIAACAQRRHPLRSVSSNGVYLILAPSLEQIADPWEKKLLKESELFGDFSDIPLIPACEVEHVYKSQSSSGPTARKIVMKNGHEILLMPSGDPNVWKRLEGKKLLGVAIDENVGDLDLIRECIARLMDANSNPEIQKEAGGGWLYWGATDTTFSEGFSWFLEQCQDPEIPDFQVFILPPDENPAIDIKEREKLRTVFGADQYSIRMEGTGTSLGLITIYGDQWDDNKHMTTGIEETQEDNLWISYDPGISHPTGILCGSVSSSNPEQIRVHRFYNHKRKTLEFDLECIADWLQGRWLEGFILDPASKQTKKALGGLNSVMSQIMSVLDDYDIKVRRGVQTGHNRHEPGIAQVRKYLDEGNVLIDMDGPGCGLFVNQMKKYRGRPATNFTGPQGVVKKDDEAPDTLRYLISKLPYWTDRPPNHPSLIKRTVTMREMVDSPSKMPESLSDIQAAHIRSLQRSAELSRKFGPKKNQRDLPF